jgi:hypothetical protein
MKSALANIGETGLCEAAYGLERAAREKNLAVISQKTPGNYCTAILKRPHLLRKMP